MNRNEIFKNSFKKLTIKDLIAKININEKKNIDNIKIEIIGKDKEEIIFKEEESTLTIFAKKENSNTNGNINVFGNNININGSFINIGNNNIIINNQRIIGNIGSKSNLIVNIEIPENSLQYIENKSSSDIDTYNISNNLEIYQMGQGDIKIKGTESILISNSGQGDIEIENVTNIDIRNSGQGDITIYNKNIIESINITSSGMGDISINANINDLQITASGMGDITVRGDIKNKNVRQSGMGDLNFYK